LVCITCITTGDSETEKSNQYSCNLVRLIEAKLSNNSGESNAGCKKILKFYVYWW
jgi:hypothetical protein